MTEHASIVDFLSASLQGLEASGRIVLTPVQQAVSDRIAARLDAELDEMVGELERIASCQQEEDDSAEPLPPFEAFCVGLRKIGDSLLPHLIGAFTEECQKEGVPTEPFSWLIRARADAFVAYLLQIAQVHGLAFDETLTAMGKSEQIALANLGANLRGIMQKEISSL
ncbi:MAG: hypothetical protein JJ850_00815 [Kordiimonadaceae bacterium]|nr:hypothetical protein [Kordiimonadaceae bacterium]MBO6567659.1 hypothetical protein [Kordiimonadaceae bacterium]MBO6963127.1 hypothetical protein [Kordiimonadaceae bacterium]